METRAHHLLIGVFVLLACSAAIFFGLWMNQSPDGDATRSYRVIFHGSVQGLSKGSPVQYNGIPVGSVTALELDPAHPGQVLVRIRVRADTPVRQDTTATITMQGLAGRNLIQLRAGADDSPILQARDGQDPIIAARASSVAQIVDHGEQAIANLNALTLSAQALLSPENIENIQKTLANVAQMTATLAEQSGEVGEVLTEVRTATRQIAHTFNDIDQIAQSLHKAIGPRAPRIVGNLDKGVASLADLLQDAHALLRDSAIPLRRALQGTSAIGPTLAELRATLAALRATLQRLDADPAGYLLNRNPLPEFTP